MANTDLKFDVSALDRASATFAKLGKTVERFERKLDQLDGKRIEAEVKVKVDDANLKKLDKGLGDSVIHIAALGKALGAIAIPASIVAAAPQLASLGAAALSASGAVGLLPAVGLAAVAAFTTLKLGTQGLGDAFKAVASGDAAKLAEALKNISPAARDLVLAVKDLGPAWKTVQLDVQEKLLAGLGEQLRKLSATYLPVVRQGLVGIAAALNQAAQGVANWLQKARVVNDIATIFNNTVAAVQRLTTVSTSMLSIFTSVGAVGSEFLPTLAASFAEAAANAAAFVARARESGDLRAWIQGGIDTIGELWQITKNAASALKGLFDAAELGGVDVLGGLERATRGLAEAINSIEGQRDIASVFREISETFTALWHASEPVRDVLSTLASTVLPALLQVLQWVAPVLVPLVSGLLALRLAAAGLAKVRALPDWLGTTQARAVGASSALQRLREELRLQQALAQGVGQSVGMFGAALGLVESRMGQFMQTSRDASSGFHNLARSTDALGERLATSIPQAAERAGTALQGAMQRAAAAVTSTLAAGFDAAAAGAQRLGQGLQRLGQSAADAIGRLGSVSIEDRVLAGWQRLSKTMDSAGDAMVAGYQRVAKAMDASGDAIIAGYQRVGKAVDSFGDGLAAGYRGVTKAVDSLGDGLASAYKSITTGTDRLGDGIAAGYRKITQATDALGTGLSATYRGITSATDSLGTALVAGYQRAAAGVDALGNAFTRIKDVPQLVTTGLQTGLTNAATAAASAGERISQVATNIGTTIRGIGTSISSVDVAGVFTRMGTAVGSAADGIASGLGRAMTAMGTFSNVVGTVGSAIGSGLTRAATSLVSFLGGPWGVAFAAASVALGLFAQNQAEAAQTAAEYKQRVEEIKNTLNGYDAAVTSATTALQAHDIASRTLSDGTTSFATALQAAGVDLKDYTAAATGNEQALAKVNGQLVKSAQEMPRLQQFWNGYRTELDAAGISYDTLAAAAIGNSQALEQVGNALGLGTGYLREQFDTITGGVGELGSALGAYAGQVKEAQEQTRTAAQAAGDFATTLDTIKPGLAGLKDGAAPLPPMAAAFKDLSSSASESAQAAGEAAAQYGGVSAGAAAASQSMQQSRDAFIAAATGAGLTAEQAAKLADQIGLIPATASTTFTTNASAVVAEIDGLKIRIDSTTGTIIIDGDPNPATGKVTQAVTFADGSTGTITVDARPDPATGKINGAVTYADGSTGTITIDGNQKPADGKIEATVTKADGSTGTVKIDADTSSAEEKLRAFLATPRTITVRTNVVASGSVQGGAGGFVAGYAGGGVVGGGKVHKFAGGGRVFPGYAPGRDRIPALLSPGEAVLVPELVRRWGADNIMRANMLASGGRPGTRVGRVPNSMAKGTGTGMAAAAAEILRQRDRDGDVFEDFTFYGASDNVANWNDRITALYRRSGIVDDDEFLRAVVAGTIGPKQPMFGGGMVRGSGRSGSPDVVAAVSSLRGQLSGLRSQMAAVTDAVRSARPITVEDRSGSPTETARMTQLALRLA